MRFLIQKRRQTPTVIIVALIDVLIVLLIFLMATTTVKQPSALRIALPESTQAKEIGANEQQTVTVSIWTNGLLRFQEGNNPELPITEDGLREKLRDQVARVPELKLSIKADKNAPVGEFFKVVDIAKENGIKMANALAKEPAKQ